MSEFKFEFNFDCNGDSPSSSQTAIEPLVKDTAKEPPKSAELGSTRVTYHTPADIPFPIDPKDVSVVKRAVGAVEVKFFSEVSVEERFLNASDNALAKALKENRDVVPSVYEGGFKLWEGAHDLLDYLSQNPDCYRHCQKGIELGCGAGLPALFLQLSGIPEVIFQDYNAEVLLWWTMPNAAINQIPSSRASFLSCDWADMVLSSECASLKHSCDIVLTAETIYSPDSYKKLIEIFDFLLSSKGVVLLACKSYYFGVGGNATEFIDVVNLSPMFACEIVASIDDNVVRHVLKVSRK